MAEQVQQGAMKDPKKVEQGRRLAEQNRRKREELAQMKSILLLLTITQYYEAQE